MAVTTARSQSRSSVNNFEFDLVPFSKSLNKVKSFVDRTECHLEIQYHLQLNSDINLWKKQNSSLERKIGLWEGTCFESFLYDKTSGEYIELNFSGTGYWNAFYFKTRNQKLSEYHNLKLQKHRFVTSPRGKFFTFKIDLKDLPFKITSESLLLGITTILNNDGREKEFFAVKHKEQRPDFHDPSTFISI